MLERSAVRLGAMMALTNGFSAPWPTVAFDKVFDSRMDPLQAGADQDELFPICLVYTDDTDREALSDNNGGGLTGWRPFCNLVLELSIGMRGDPIQNDGDEEPLFDVRYPQTVPELEAMLDTFEHQVHRALFHPTNAWAQRFQNDLIVRCESWSSQRFVERDGNARLAARQINARLMLRQPDDDAVYAAAAAGTDSNLPAPAIPAPLGPLIDAVIEAGGPYVPSAQSMKDLILSAGPVATDLELPLLDRLRFVESDEGGGMRPDGVGEVIWSE